MADEEPRGAPAPEASAEESPPSQTTEAQTQGPAGPNGPPLDPAGLSQLRLFLNLPVVVETAAGPAKIHRHAIGVWFLALDTLAELGEEIEAFYRIWESDSTEKAAEMNALFARSVAGTRDHLIRLMRLVLAPKFRGREQYVAFLDAGDEETSEDRILYGFTVQDYERLIGTWVKVHDPGELLKNVVVLGQGARVLVGPKADPRTGL